MAKQVRPGNQLGVRHTATSLPPTPCQASTLEWRCLLPPLGPEHITYGMYLA